MSSNVFQVFKSVRSLLLQPPDGESKKLTVANLVAASLGLAADVAHLVLAVFVLLAINREELPKRDLFLGLCIAAGVFFLLDVVVSAVWLRQFAVKVVDGSTQEQATVLALTTLLLPSLQYACLSLGCVVTIGSNSILLGNATDIRVFEHRPAFAFLYVSTVQCCCMLVASYFLFVNTSAQGAQSNLFLTVAGLPYYVALRNEWNKRKACDPENILRLLLHVLTAACCGLNLLLISDFCTVTGSCHNYERTIATILTVAALIACWIYVLLFLFLCLLALMIFLMFVSCCTSDDTYYYKNGKVYKFVGYVSSY